MNVFKHLLKTGNEDALRLELIDWFNELVLREESSNTYRLQSILTRYSRYIERKQIADVYYHAIDECFKRCSIDLSIYGIDIDETCLGRGCRDCANFVIDTILNKTKSV